MSVAVILSTYNGNKYIIEQLESIRNQTRNPDHVYISDDCSNDNTVSLIRAYIQENGLTHWTLDINTKNKGWKKNFRDLILQCEEDIIFPCDQDDIWYPEKIREMSEILERRNEIDLLACGYSAQYEDKTRKITNRITKDMTNSGKVFPIEMSGRFMDVLRPGCAFAVRKSFCEQISCSWNDSLPHDAMIWRCAVINGSAYLYDKKLMSWRRYDTSNSNPNRNRSDYNNKYEMLRQFYKKNAESHILFLKCAHQLILERKIRSSEETKELLGLCLQYEEKMIDAYTTNDVISMLMIGLCYRRFVPSLKTVLWNVYVILKVKLSGK